MKIAICGSMSFAKEMAKTKEQLEKIGHAAEVPYDTQKFIDEPNYTTDNHQENYKHCLEYNIIKKGFDAVAESDAILVLNYPKNNISGYIGASSLMEIGIAYYLNKKIFLLYPPPPVNETKYSHEILIMQPIIIDRNLNLIMEEKFLKIKEIAEKEISCSAHKFDHSLRVYSLALKLAEDEKIDFEVIKAAALLHDIGGAKEINDSTGNTDHATVGAEMALPILKDLGFEEEKIKRIQHCIISHRYKTDNKPASKEAQIIFDADKLDSLGAVGIARAFAWVGKNNANIYKKADIEEYKKENLGGKTNGRIQDKTKHSPQIEFETKIRFLIDNLYTEKAKKICLERTEYYKNFLDRLEKEIKGEA